MKRQALLLTATVLAASIAASNAQAQTKPAGPPLKAEVIHWWTSGGESAAVKTLADAYRAAGGEWQDTAIALGEQARSVAINRIIGGKAPTAAQFNTTKQFYDIVDQGLLNNVDDVAIRDGWDKFLPEVVLNVIRVKGHYYAAPVNIHMPAWAWTSKAAFKKAGIKDDPKTMDELFADLDKLKAAGIVPLAHGGQGWQDNTVFTFVLSNVGGRELYLKLFRDRDPAAIKSDAFKNVLLTFKRLHNYVDKGSPGRNWNDATAMIITGRAGIQIMGDWAKGEFSLAKQEAGKDYGCVAGFGPKSLYVIQGDVMVFPRTSDPKQVAAQKLLASVITNPQTQVAFSMKKGSVPIRTDVDASKMDVCAQAGLAILKDKSRQIGNGESYITPDQNGALQDVISNYWNRDIPVEKVQKDIIAALRD